ncbi:hypothetical protein [Minwuia sp.]|uniref:hypothetical protein n=1 Tax=Minwuia sp. TaxID=2493630 RepID=UPI003A92EEE3
MGRVVFPGRGLKLLCGIMLAAGLGACTLIPDAVFETAGSAAASSAAGTSDDGGIASATLATGASGKDGPVEVGFDEIAAHCTQPAGPQPESLPLIAAGAAAQAVKLGLGQIDKALKDEIGRYTRQTKLVRLLDLPATAAASRMKTGHAPARDCLIFADDKGAPVLVLEAGYLAGGSVDPEAVPLHRLGSETPVALKYRPLWLDLNGFRPERGTERSHAVVVTVRTAHFVTHERYSERRPQPKFELVSFRLDKGLPGTGGLSPAPRAEGYSRPWSVFPALGTPGGSQRPGSGLVEFHFEIGIAANPPTWLKLSDLLFTSITKGLPEEAKKAVEKLLD